MDTITATVTMEVCANPASIGFSLYDTDTGLSFTYSITSPETVSVPTGLMVGIPDIGSAEIILVLTLSGNIDYLTIYVGMDLSVTVLGFTETCSAVDPSVCPVQLLSETIDFGNYCA